MTAGLSTRLCSIAEHARRRGDYSRLLAGAADAEMWSPYTKGGGLI